MLFNIQITIFEWGFLNVIQRCYPEFLSPVISQFSWSLLTWLLGLDNYSEVLGAVGKHTITPCVFRISDCNAIQQNAPREPLLV